MGYDMTGVRTKRAPAYGVGINDANYPVTTHEVVGGKRRIVWKCPVYTVWRSMLTRCYSPSYQRAKPTYVGCSVAPEWHSFSAFRAWAITKNYTGKQLDKDLLCPGNKVYSPATCCFISRRVNGFLLDNKESRGEYPVGVSWHGKLRKVQARCSDPNAGGADYLGVFSCPNEAHKAWAAKKLEYAKILASEVGDAVIAEALLRRFERVYALAVGRVDSLTQSE